MDNASKALIMAGAILIAVALVGVGVYMYSSAAGQVDNATGQLSAAEIQLKNSEFEQYETGSGDSIKGIEAKQLVRKVLAFNSENVFPERIKMYSVASGTGTEITKATQISDNLKYTVKCEYNTNGYIDIVRIVVKP